MAASMKYWMRLSHIAVDNSIHGKHLMRSSKLPVDRCLLNTTLRLSSCPRCYTTQQEPQDRVIPPNRTRRYLLDKLMNFISSSADRLEKRIPSVFQVYRTFKTGMKDFVADSKEYYRVSSRLWSGECLGEFSRKELELYRQFSADLPIMGLIFLMVFAPGGAAVFPFAYVFPRQLLSPHFWTPEQKEEFRRITMAKQVKHYDSALDYLHLLSQHIANDSARDNMQKAIKKLDSRVPLSNNEILTMLPLFEGKPYKMECISVRHMRHLGKSLGLSLRRKKLVKDAIFLHYIDKAMVREGIFTMTDDELDKACCWRGLNPQGLRRKDKIAYLEDWTQISTFIYETSQNFSKLNPSSKSNGTSPFVSKAFLIFNNNNMPLKKELDIPESSISMLLHLPVFLGYCQPTNRELMPKRVSRKRGKL